MQIIAGQNVSPNSMPGPTGFGFGSGHNPNAAAVMMNNSGVAPTTSRTRPTLTHVDLRYWRMADCGLTVKLRGRTEAPDTRRGRTLSPGARGAKPPTLHGPLQRLLDANAAAVKQKPPLSASTTTSEAESLRPTSLGFTDKQYRFAESRGERETR